MARLPYRKSVFLNCPFDDEYSELFDALVFTIHDCGFSARCALELDDSAQVRLEKLVSLIRECRLGIHDLSRTEPDPVSLLPRFNMPLELGIFFGARLFGDRGQREKICLVLDRERYRYQVFCSDIAGQDIRAHSNDVPTLITVVRNWLRNSIQRSGVRIPSGSRIADRYAHFLLALPTFCSKLNLEMDELVFNDYTTLVVGWLRENRW